MYLYDCEVLGRAKSIEASSAEDAIEKFVDELIWGFVSGKVDKSSPIYDHLFESLYDVATVTGTNEPEDHPSLTLEERNL